MRYLLGSLTALHASSCPRRPAQHPAEGRPSGRSERVIVKLAGHRQSTSDRALRLPQGGKTPAPHSSQVCRPEPSCGSPCPPSRIFHGAEGCLVLLCPRRWGEDCDVGLLIRLSRVPCSLFWPFRSPGRATAVATIPDTQAAAWTSSGLEATITPKASRRMTTHLFAMTPGGLQGDACSLPPQHVRPDFLFGSKAHREQCASPPAPARGW